MDIGGEALLSYSVQDFCKNVSKAPQVQPFLAAGAERLLLLLLAPPDNVLFPPVEAPKD